MDAQGFLGSGDLYIDRLESDGTSTGLLKMGLATKFEIKPDSEVKELTSKGRGTYGQVATSVVLPKPTQMSIELQKIDKEILAMAFMGDHSLINEAAGSITDEVVLIANKGKYADLAHRNIVEAGILVQRQGGVNASAREDTTDYSVDDYAIPATPNDHFYKCLTAGTSSAAPPTWVTNGGSVTDGTVTWVDMGEIDMVLDVDFEIHYRLGMIMPLADSDVEPGESLLVDYDYNAASGALIKGATQPIIKARLVLDGENYADGKETRVEAYEVTLKPSSSIDWMADDFLSVSLEGSLVTPSGKDHPFKVEQFD